MLNVCRLCECNREALKKSLFLPFPKQHLSINLFFLFKMKKVSLRGAVYSTEFCDICLKLTSCSYVTDINLTSGASLQT